MAVKAACRSAVRADISAKLRPCISLMSAPAANTLSPPHRTTAPTPSSSPASVAASRSSSWTWALSAFTGGRSSRMVPTRLASSTSRCTNSPTSGPSRLFGSGRRIVCAAPAMAAAPAQGSGGPDGQALVVAVEDEVRRRPGPGEAKRGRAGPVGGAPPAPPGQRPDIDRLPAPRRDGGIEDDDADLRTDGQVAGVAGGGSRHPEQVGVALVGEPHRGRPGSSVAVGGGQGHVLVRVDDLPGQGGRITAAVRLFHRHLRRLP